MNYTALLLSIPPILLALSFHEYAHAWMANRKGDPTAKMLGRLTMNPLAHLDPMGTLMIVIVHFGWAKPVPVNPMNLKDPQKRYALDSSCRTRFKCHYGGGIGNCDPFDAWNGLTSRRKFSRTLPLYALFCCYDKSRPGDL